MEAVLFAKAETAIQEAVKDHVLLAVHLLDITRAATLLAGWLWAQEKDGQVSEYAVQLESTETCS